MMKGPGLQPICSPRLPLFSSRSVSNIRPAPDAVPAAASGVRKDLKRRPSTRRAFLGKRPGFAKQNRLGWENNHFIASFLGGCGGGWGGGVQVGAEGGAADGGAGATRSIGAERNTRVAQRCCLN